MKKFSLFEKLIVMLSLLFVIVIGGYEYFFKIGTPIASFTNHDIYVSLLGEVNSPGTFLLKPGTTVESAVILAGDFTKNADLKEVDLSQKLNESCEIIVPSLREKESGGENSTGLPNAFGDNFTISINEAMVHELIRIPGIGEVKAAAIVAYRDEYGPFKDVNELLLVSGIGEKTLENIRNYIRI